MKVYILLYKEIHCYRRKAHLGRKKNTVGPEKVAQQCSWGKAGRHLTSGTLPGGRPWSCLQPHLCYLSLLILGHCSMTAHSYVAPPTSGLPPWTGFSVTQSSEFSTHLSKSSSYPNHFPMPMGNTINVFSTDYYWNCRVMLLGQADEVYWHISLCTLL